MTNPTQANEQINSLRNWLSAILVTNNPGQLPEPSISINEITQYIAKEGIAPLLSHKLRASNNTDQVPKELMDFLLTAERKCAVEDLIRSKQNKILYKDLISKEIDFLLLKGEALGNTIYPTSYLRTRGDTDILFRDKASAELAWPLLEKRGYRRANTLDGKFVGFQFNCYKTLDKLRSSHIDVHHKLSDYIWLANRFPYEELLSESITFSIDSIKLKTTGPIYSLLHACIHRASNKTSKNENRLIWLYDIHLLCDELTPEHWAALVLLARQKSLCFIVFDALNTSKSLLGTYVPDRFLNELQKTGSTEKNPFGKTTRRWHLYFYDYRNNRGMRNKATQLREHALPNYRYMKKKYPKANSWNLPYYYIKRLASGLKKYF